MRVESRNWRPSRWSEEAIRRRMRRVYRVALSDMGDLIGPYNADLVYAEMMGKLKSEQSRVELTRRGVPMLG